MWVAGLRGAMAYALSIESIKDYPSGKVMLVITLIYSLFSVLFIGSIMGPILKLIGVEKTQEDLQTQIEIDESFYAGEGNAFERVINWGEKMKVFLYQFNQKHFRPIFVVSQPNADEVHESNLSPRSQLEKPKRRSDSELIEAHPDDNHLKVNRLDIIRKVEDRKQLEVSDHNSL